MSFRIVKDRDVTRTIIEKTLVRSAPDITFPHYVPVPAEKEEKPSYNKLTGHASDSVGYKNTSSGFASFSQGKESVARLRTQVAHAGGSFIAPGDVQYARAIIKARNNQSSIARFKLDDVEEYVIHGTETSALLKVDIFGASDDALRKCYYGKIRCLVKTYSKEPRLVLDNIAKKTIFGPPGWKIDVSAEPPGSVCFIATISEEDISADVRWIATIESFEHHHDVLDFNL